MTVLSCNLSLWFPYWVRKDLLPTAPALLSPHAPLTQHGPKMSVPTPPSEAWGSAQQKGLLLIQREEEEQHQRVTACPVLPALSGPNLTSVSRYIYYSRGNSPLAP